MQVYTIPNPSPCSHNTLAPDNNKPEINKLACGRGIFIYSFIAMTCVCLLIGYSTPATAVGIEDPVVNQTEAFYIPPRAYSLAMCINGSLKDAWMLLPGT